MGWLQRMNDRRSFPVVAAAEAILGGDRGSWVVARGSERPERAVVFRLAHADRALLRDFVRSSSLTHPASWPSIMGRLAAAMLRKAPGPEALVALQRRTLIPLELAVLAGEVELPNHPDQLASVVLEALSDHPSRS